MPSRGRSLVIAEQFREDRRDYVLSLIAAGIARMVRGDKTEIEGFEDVDLFFDYLTNNPNSRSHINDKFNLSEWPRK